MNPIIICDDDPICLDLAGAILWSQKIPAICFDTPQKTLEFLSTQTTPTVAILDVDMPDKTGYELCAEIHKIERCKDLPVIFLTARSSPKDEAAAFRNGGTDFITKPINPEVFLARVTSVLQNERAKNILREHEAELQRRVNEKTLELATLQTITIYALTSLCGERDQETGSHIVRTQHYVKIIAQALNVPHLTLFRYAPLHDIGKIGIPDHILLKPGKLTGSEFDVIKTHTLIGHRALIGALTEAAETGKIPDLEIAAKIIRSHHERWDGDGYPDKLAGNKIPLEARIMAAADVYDALRSRRPYKEPMHHKDALEIIRNGSGSHFDPDIAEAVDKSEAAFQEISERHQADDHEIATTRERMTKHQPEETATPVARC